MNAAAMVMVALLIHFGGAGFDSSSSATVTRFEGSLQRAQWQVDRSSRSDGWTLSDDDHRIHVQRLRDVDGTYALVSRPSASVAIVSFSDIRDRRTATMSAGAGMIPWETILVGWDGPESEPEPVPDNEDAPAGSVLHYRWAPGETTVSFPDRSELFILRYR